MSGDVQAEGAPINLEPLSKPYPQVGDLAAALSLQVADFWSSQLPPMLGHFHSEELPGRVRRVNGTFAHDIHHQHEIASAEELARRTLLGCSVHFRAGRDRCEAELRATHGAPREHPEERQYGLFFIRPWPEDAFVLSWYAKEPDWARPPVDPELRKRAVAALPDVEPDPAAGIVSDRPGHYELQPPMPALDCAEALGVPDAIAESVGMYMDRFRLVRLVDGRGELPRRAGVEVEAHLDGPPSGEAIPDPPPTIARKRLAAGDTVRYISFGG